MSFFADLRHFLSLKMTLSSLLLHLFNRVPTSRSWHVSDPGGHEPHPLPTRRYSGHTHRISFSRGDHEAVAWGTWPFRSADRLFSYQVAGCTAGLRATGTIPEHRSVVKRDGRDLLDKLSVGRYSRLRDRERCCLGDALSGSTGSGACREREDLQCHRNGA